MRTDRQTDMTQLVIVFDNFANASKIVSLNVMNAVSACIPEEGRH